MTTTSVVTLCYSCVNFMGDGVCMAYPDGIPDAILIYGADHRSPIPGDHGILYRTRPDDPRAQPLLDLYQAHRDRVVAKHWGPGPHPGSGTPQEVHGGGGVAQWLGDLTMSDAPGAGGFSFSFYRHRQAPSHSFIVSPYERESRPLDPDVFVKHAAELIRDFKTEHAALLRLPAHYVGGYRDRDSGKVFLDVSIVTDDRAEAHKLAVDHDQISYWDTDKGTEVRVGGTGGLGKGFSAKEPWSADQPGGQVGGVREGRGLGDGRGHGGVRPTDRQGGAGRGGFKGFLIRTLTKGEGLGHPFRGNQWTGGKGGSGEGIADAVARIHEDTAIRQVEDRVRAHYTVLPPGALWPVSTARSASIPTFKGFLLRSGETVVVPVKEEHADVARHVGLSMPDFETKTGAVRLTFQPSFYGFHDRPDLAHSMLAAQLARAITLPQYRALVANVGDRNYIDIGSGVNPKVSLSLKQPEFSREMRRFLEVRKGEGPGHPFRGNQWTGGIGGGGANETDYRGQHQPPEDGPPLHDLLAGDSWMPDDVYAHPEWYAHGSGEAWERQTLDVVRRVRGNPDATVTIYRAAPPGLTHLNHGDWVALAEGYGRQHAMDPTDPSKDWPIYAVEVPAKWIRNGGNDLIEWGYWGPSVKVHVVPSLTKGEGPGHPFRGNQWTGGIGGGGQLILPGTGAQALRQTNAAAAAAGALARDQQRVATVQDQEWGTKLGFDNEESEYAAYDDDDFQDVIDTWSGRFLDCRDIREAAADMMGIDTGHVGTVDPFITSEVSPTWASGGGLVPSEAKEAAFRLLSAVDEGSTQPVLWRGSGANSSPIRANLHRGDIIDLPLASFSNDRDTTKRFGTSVIIKVQSGAKGIPAGQMEEPTYRSWDEIPYELRHADMVEQNYGNGLSVGHMGGYRPGDPIPEHLDSESFYDYLDRDDVPHEVITGGRFRVVHIAERSSDGGGITITLEQMGTFDPRTGAVAKAMGVRSVLDPLFDYSLAWRPPTPPPHRPPRPRKLVKGEHEGHPFRGNQWTGGKPGMGGLPKIKAWTAESPFVHGVASTLDAMRTQFDAVERGARSNDEYRHNIRTLWLPNMLGGPSMSVPPGTVQQVADAAALVAAQPLFRDLARMYGPTMLTVTPYDRLGFVPPYAAQYHSDVRQVAVYESGDYRANRLIESQDISPLSMKQRERDGAPLVADESIAGTLRHEYGHHVSAVVFMGGQNVPNEKKHQFNAVTDEIDKLRTARAKAIHVALKPPVTAGKAEASLRKISARLAVSTYATSGLQDDIEEEWAEVFSVVSHPNYQRNRWPEELHPVLTAMEDFLS